MDAVTRSEKEIRRRLARFRLRAKALAFRTGLWQWIAFSFMWGALLSGLEAVWWFPPRARLLLFGLGIVGLFVSGLFLVGRPMASFLRPNRPDDETLALEIGRRIPPLRDRLADALQVLRRMRAHPDEGSLALAEVALLSTHDALQSLDLDAALDRAPLSRARKWGILGVLVTLFFCGFLGLFPATDRILHYRRVYPRPWPFTLAVRVDSPIHPSGRPLSLHVLCQGERQPTRVVLEILPEGGTKQAVSLSPPFRHTIPSVKQDLTLLARSGKVRSEPVRIRIYQDPGVKAFRLTLFPPPYTKEPPVRLPPNQGGIEALKGTRVHLGLQATAPLRYAAILFDSIEIHPMRVSGTEAEGEWWVTRPGRYAVIVEDTAGRRNPDLLFFPIHLRADAPPWVQVLSPGRDTEVEKGMQLPLRVQAEDDYGLFRLRFGYFIHREDTPPETLFTTLPLDRPQPRRVLLDWTWDMRDIGLLPEDRASYFFEGWDTDREAGPKRGRSPLFSVYFPSMMEMYARLEEAQTRQVETLESLYAKGLAMQEELRRLSDEVKLGRQAGWEGEKQIQAQSERVAEMEAAIQELSAQLEEMIRQMETRELVRQETIEKYRELQALYQEIATPELREAMQALQEALERLPESLREAVDRVRLSQEAVLQALDRTLNLLKRLKVEQQVEALARHMAELKARQEALNQEITSGRGPDPTLAERETRLREEVAGVEKALADLRAAMSSLQGMPEEAVAEIASHLAGADLPVKMDAIANRIRGGDRREAGQLGEEVAGILETLSQRLDSLHHSLTQGHKARIVEAMRQTQRRLLLLSERQEALASEHTDQAAPQVALSEVLSRLIESLYGLSQQTFFVTPEIGRALGRAQAEMRQAAASLAEKGPNAALHQRAAVGSLNQAVLAMEKALEAMQGASSGVGGEAFLMGLEGLSAEQMALNRKLLDLLNQGRLGLEDQAALERLAAGQEALRRRLERLLAEQGERSDVLGRLDDLIREMDAVSQEIRERKADRETVRRQERILSRLLEAQHSLRTQEEGDLRRARTGEDIRRAGPPALEAFRPDARTDRIRRELLRLREIGLAGDYERLVRAYLEALETAGRKGR